MGKIATYGGPKALDLFVKILVASTSIPGAFPPMMIDVEVNGKHYQEMHVDGGVVAQVFAYPAAIRCIATVVAPFTSPQCLCTNAAICGSPACSKAK